MKVTDFTEHKIVLKIISDLKSKPRKFYSDLTDSENHQYVDLVQEGGGVLGIALLGYTYVLEEMGIRFFSLAGTSAGAINTMLLASSGFPEEAKTKKIIETLANTNLFDFVDGPFFIRLLIKMIRTKQQSEEQKWYSILISILKIFASILLGIPTIIYLIIKKGLNPGSSFEKWISDILAKENIYSTLDLSKIRRQPPGINLVAGQERGIQDLEPQLKIVVTELTTESRVIFPKMNCLFWDNPDNINPAKYVRASMSIPLFFHPLRVKKGMTVSKENWYELARFHGALLPDTFYFVDGGVLSNFPIDAFHNRRKVPRLPTFGVKLGDDRNEINSVKSITKFLFSMFNSARHVLDYQFLLCNEDYEKLIKKIDIGSHNWLNFSISDEDKIDLFIRGAKAASEFLESFDWENYKEIRLKNL